MKLRNFFFKSSNSKDDQHFLESNSNEMTKCYDLNGSIYDEKNKKKSNVAFRDNIEINEKVLPRHRFKTPLIYYNIFFYSLFHILAVYALYVLSTFSYVKNLYTIIWIFFVTGVAGFGVTGGVHRLWSHKSYKAKLPLRIILMICYSVSGQNRIFDWVRDHRVHHKFTETDADPHNSNRGFFFAHVGWLMMRKHPEVLRRGQQVNMSDVLADPVVQFHEKYFLTLKLLFCFIIPSVVPYFCWGETLYNGILSQSVVRYILSLNFTWLVNSAAHIWGNRPYDKNINPKENIGVAFVAMGEGWHNYHHVFPWDYKAAELGNYGLNITTFWIDLFAKIGWAYDLKTPSKDMVRRIVQRKGDGTHSVFSTDVLENENNNEC